MYRKRYEIPRSSTLILILAGCILILGGCRWIIGLRDRYIKREIKTSELVGTWIITDDSLKRLTKEGYSKYLKKEDQKFTLFEDGTCKGCCYFTLLNNPTPEKQEKNYRTSFEGTWAIGRRTTYIHHKRVEVSAIDITIETVTKGPKSMSVWLDGYKFFIYEDRRGLVLWDYLGDPDYEKYRDFVRTTSDIN